jgi:hypothetical protein
MKPTLTLLTALLLAPLAALQAAEIERDASPDGSYAFDGKISREVLQNYLARSINMTGLVDSDQLDEDLRMLNNVGAKYIGRAAIVWWSDTKRLDIEKHFAAARRLAERLHNDDSELLLEAGVMETVGPGVDAIPIPAWVFQAFSLPAQSRRFDHRQMAYDGGARGHGHGTIPPDISKPETRLWFYYCCRRYIDSGYESIHLGMIGHMDRKDPGHQHWFDVLGRLRAYAKEHARRHLVLFNSQVPDGIVENGRLLLDHHQMQLRPVDVKARPEECVLQVGYGDTIWGRSLGGVTPSGWTCEHLPYYAQMDNGYAPGKAGQSVGFPFAWGSCEIDWFARQPEAFRNQWLQYAHKWIRQNDPVGFLQMPGRVPLGEPGKTPGGTTGMYRANTRSAASPQGFGQEETIKAIWGNCNR